MEIMYWYHQQHQLCRLQRNVQRRPSPPISRSAREHSASLAHTLVVPLLFLPTTWYDIV